MAINDDILSDPDMQERLIETALQKYYKYKFLGAAGDKVLGGLLGNRQGDLDTKSKELEIMQRQRELGLPEGTEDKSKLGSAVFRSLAKGVIDPKPGQFNVFSELTKAKDGALTISKSFTGVLPSLAKPLAKESRYARIFGPISRAVGF